MPCSKEYPDGRRRWRRPAIRNPSLSLAPLGANTSYYREDARNAAGSAFKMTRSRCCDFPSFGI